MKKYMESEIEFLSFNQSVYTGLIDGDTTSAGGGGSVDFNDLLGTGGFIE